MRIGRAFPIPPVINRFNIHLVVVATTPMPKQVMMF